MMPTVPLQVLGGSMVFPNTREHLIPMKVADGLRPKRSDFPKIRDHKEADIVWPVLVHCWHADPRARSSMKSILESLSSHLLERRR